MFVLRIGHVFLTIATLLSLGAARAEAAGYNHLVLSNEAIGGFDAVSYWRGGEPMPGSRAFRYEWQGTVWLFANQRDLDAFKASPQTYAPAFGGYCAYAMTKGIKADIQPYFFKIEGKKLYFFFSADARDEFASDPGAIGRARDHWSAIERLTY